MKNICVIIFSAGVAWLVYDLIKSGREYGWRVAVYATFVILFASVIAFLALMGIFYTVTVLAVMVLP